MSSSPRPFELIDQPEERIAVALKSNSNGRRLVLDSPSQDTLFGRDFWLFMKGSDVAWKEVG